MTRIIRALSDLKAIENIELLTEAVSPVHMDPRAEVLKLRDTMQDIKAIRVEEIKTATLFRRVFQFHSNVEKKRATEVKAKAHWANDEQNFALREFWQNIARFASSK